MRALVLTSRSVIMCAHGGRVHHILTSPRVTAGGGPLLISGPRSHVAGCPQPHPPLGPGGCVVAEWAMPSFKVRSGGKPLLLASSIGTTRPVGYPVTTLPVQTRVRAT